MKSIVLRSALILAAFAVVPNAFAADTSSGNFFLNAKFGEMTNSSDWGDGGPSTQTHTSWGAGGGYLWKLNEGGSLGLELGYMHFGDISDGIDALGFATETTSANATTAGALFQQPFSDDAWYVQARVGWMWAKLNSSTNSSIPDQPAATFTDSWNENGHYIGFGIGRNITQDLSLTLAYTRYNSSDTRFGGDINLGVNWLGLEAQYRF